jgi:hypothetical protein
VKYLVISFIAIFLHNINSPNIDKPILKIEKNFKMLERLKDLIANNFIAKKIQEKK